MNFDYLVGDIWPRHETQDNSLTEDRVKIVTACSFT